jgi:hypothetical protein
MPIKHSLRNKMTSAVLLIALTAVIVAIWSNFQHLRMLPEALRVSHVIYAREESWGFGPGGNETGVVVFELPTDVASNIERQGMEFLEHHLPAQDSRSRIPFRWKETPARVEGSGDDTNSSLNYDITQYLNRYGFGILIDAEVTRDINDALSSKGNFIDDNGRRLIIIVPKAGKVIFAYRG